MYERPPAEKEAGDRLTFTDLGSKLFERDDVQPQYVDRELSYLLQPLVEYGGRDAIVFDGDVAADPVDFSADLPLFNGEVNTEDGPAEHH